MDWRHTQTALLSVIPVDPREALAATKSGVYAWWDAAGVLDRFRPAECPEFDWRFPVYVGKAQRSIGARFEKMHLAETRQSSLRRSLAGLLYQELDLLPGVTAVGDGKMVVAPAEEERLTWWMLQNLTVTWVQLGHAPGPIEKEVICNLSPLLNDLHAMNSPYRVSVRRARAMLCQLAQTYGSSAPSAGVAEDPE